MLYSLIVKNFIFIFIVSIFSLSKSFAQRSPTVFGQTRVQYEKFQWTVTSTSNFDIYYYGGGEKMAEASKVFAEKEYERIANLLGYYSFRKIKLLLYHSQADLKQSNIGLSVDKYQTVTENKYIKNKIEVAYPGTLVGLKKEISLQITRLLINEMVYGSGMGELIQSSYFVSLPEWFSEGLAHYATHGWSVEMDNYTRNGKTPGSMARINNLRGEKALLIGHSIWNYIAEKYGTESIPSIMNFVRLSRDERMSITNTLGLNYRDFFNDYEKFYNQSSSIAIEQYEDISTLQKLSTNKNQKLKINSFAVNPSGSKLAYSAKIDGKTKVFLTNFEKGKTKTIFSKGIKDRAIKNNNLPVLAWKNNSELFVIYNKNNRLVLQKLNGKAERKTLTDFEHVNSFSFSKDGSQMVMSAVNKSQTDIYVYIPKLKKNLKLTNDLYDDLNPVFWDDERVLFSSNRKTNGNDLENVEDNFNIYVLNILERENPYVQLTKGIGNEIYPQKMNDDEIVFLSDELGVNALYKYNLTDSTQQLLKICFQNMDGISTNENNIYLFANEGEKNSIRLLEKNNVTPISLGLKTKRQQALEDRYFKIISDSVQNTTNFIPAPKGKVLAPYKGLTFSINKMRSGVKIDPLFGFGSVFEITLTDMMENHKMSGGIFMLADFTSSSIHAEYEYLKHRLDFKIYYERENYFYYDEFNLMKFSGQKAKGSVVYPFSRISSVSMSSGWAQTRATFLDFSSIFREDFITNFLTENISFVYDNTYNKDVNALLGTRLKISVDGFWEIKTSVSSISPKDENFKTINFDLRNYKKVLGVFTFANKLSGGRSFGNAPKTFIFGGMDNWFAPRTEINETPPPQSPADILYLSYATTVRGFNYNIRNGNSFALLNSEIRIFYRDITGLSTYKSNFINHLQFSMFTDIGTAWSGNDPFSKDNSINKTVVGGLGSKSYQVTVYNYRSPLVMGFGGGVRTVFLGTYLKFDLGWGIEDFKVRGPLGYLTLGYDF